ncbi:MAG: Spy/CpxP family protein refolding chaperone [Proteobacteria bacterium]|nr:Spy/CpxP family protein refolding chaperone [Pseudomonadota bacterium]
MRSLKPTLFAFVLAAVLAPAHGARAQFVTPGDIINFATGAAINIITAPARILRRPSAQPRRPFRWRASEQRQREVRRPSRRRAASPPSLSPPSLATRSAPVIPLPVAAPPARPDLLEQPGQNAAVASAQDAPALAPAARPRGEDSAASAPPRPSGSDVATMRAAIPSNARQAERAPPGDPAWAGPVFWPHAFDDIFNYAFLRNSGRDRFWRYGVGDILGGLAAMSAAMLAAPAQNAAASAEDIARLTQARNSAGARDVAASPAALAALCVSKTGPDWPGKWIRDTLAPTSTQREKLTALDAAFAGAAEYLLSSCPSTADATSPALATAAHGEADDATATAVGMLAERLDRMRTRIWSMRQAIVAVRFALADLYASLGDQQKIQLNDYAATYGPQAGAAAHAACIGMAADASTAPPDTAKMAPSLSQGGLAAADPMAVKLGEFLANTCPPKTPPTALARLDAMADRLIALEFAVFSIDPAMALPANASQHGATQSSNRLTR